MHTKHNRWLENSMTQENIRCVTRARVATRAPRLLLLMALSSLVPSVWAATFDVPCQVYGPGGLVEVMQTAATNVSNDTIRLAPGCTYSITQAASIFNDVSDVGLPAHTTATAGDLIVEGQGARIERASSAPEFRLMRLGGNRFTLRALTLANGVSRGQAGQRGDSNPGSSAEGGNFNGIGGAILFDGAFGLTLERCRFEGNRAIGGTGGDGTAVTDLAQAAGGGGGGGAYGGALAFVGSGSLTIHSSTFVGNESEGGAGGGVALGVVSGGGGGGGTGGDGGLPGLDGFTATAGGGGGGAGYGETTAAEGGDGVSGGGGGAGFSPGDPRAVDGVVIIGGAGGRFGGGGGVGIGGAIYMNGGGLFSPTLTLINTSFIDNVAVGGRGTRDGAGAAAAGGAIYLRSTGTVQLRHVTAANNTSLAGNHGEASVDRNGATAMAGGMFAATSVNSLTLANSVFADNQVLPSPATGAGSIGLASAPDLSATFTSLGFNLVRARQGATGFSGQDVAEGVDARLRPGPGADSGYLVPTLDSPLLDAVPLVQCSTLDDQRGTTRPQRAACDIGSVEATEKELITVFLDGFE